MATDNSTKKLRKSYFTSNKYQKEIILLVFIPSVLIYLTFICIVFISNPDLSKALLHVSFYDKAQSVSHLAGLIVFLMSLFFLLSVIAAFVISHNMIGAYGRITRELDEIIAGRSQKKINCRPHDTLTQDLLKRINVLVESYVKHEKKNP
jgi:sensor histidine kinase YesM